MMDEIERLKCELEKMRCMTAELKYKLDEYESGNFKIVSRETAVLEVLKNSKSKVFQVGISNEYVGDVNNLIVSELSDDKETFYVIQKG